jgi:hypothetical protein
MKDPFDLLRRRCVMVDAVEDVAPARDGAARQTAGHDLGLDAEVRCDAERLLRTAG